MAKQKAATKPKVKTVAKEPELIKVKMLFDITYKKEDLAYGSIQHLPPYVVGAWEHPSRRYCKRI